MNYNWNDEIEKENYDITDDEMTMEWRKSENFDLKKYKVLLVDIEINYIILLKKKKDPNTPDAL